MTAATQPLGADPANQEVPVLEAIHVTKHFGATTALVDVSIQARARRIVALLGDNGAGKSTLIKIIAGLYSADEGGLLLDGEPVTFAGPKDAVDAGIATVYQDLALVDARDVAANVFLGSEFTRGPFVDKKRCRTEAEKLLRHGLVVGAEFVQSRGGEVFLAELTANQFNRSTPDGVSSSIGES